MEVGHGPKGSRPAGSLPVFTVQNSDEARKLLTLACPLNYRGQYVAPELAQEQTMENLEAFGARLEQLYNKFIREK